MFIGASMLSNTAVIGAALVSWNSTDGIARMKTKKEQPPRPLIRSSGLDSVSLNYILFCTHFWFINPFLSLI